MLIPLAACAAAATSMPSSAKRSRPSTPDCRFGAHQRARDQAAGVVVGNDNRRFGRLRVVVSRARRRPAIGRRRRRWAAERNLFCRIVVSGAHRRARYQAAGCRPETTNAGSVAYALSSGAHISELYRAAPLTLGGGEPVAARSAGLSSEVTTAGGGDSRLWGSSSASPFRGLSFGTHIDVVSIG